MLYKDWAPSTLDRKGLHAEAWGIADWRVLPIVLTPDSDVYIQVNFDEAKKRLENIEEWRELHFDNRVCGWVKIIVVNPNSPAAEIAEDIEEDIYSDGCLDHEEADERMDEMFRKLWEEELHEWFVDTCLDNLSDPPTDEEMEMLTDKELTLRAVMELDHPYYAEGSGIGVYFDDLVFDDKRFKETLIPTLREVKEWNAVCDGADGNAD